MIVALLVVTQLAIPPLAERMASDRLTENGGNASVEISAVPALGLLFGGGGNITVNANDLDLELPDDDERVMERLDGFDEVEIRIAASQAGPVSLEEVTLTRTGGDAPYFLQGTAVTTPDQLVEFSSEELGLAGLAISQAADLLFGTAIDPDVPIPIELDLGFISDDGRVDVTSGGGSVAGIPTGPLAQIITAAIVVQL